MHASAPGAPLLLPDLLPSPRPLSAAAEAAELGSVEAAKEAVCSQVALEDYNLGLHIGAVFILLGVSAAGALLPVALHISSRSSTVLAVIKLGTFFGEQPAGILQLRQQR